MSQTSQTKIAGIIVVVVIIGAIAFLGYFQFYVAPNIFTNTITETTGTTQTTQTTQTTSVSCTRTSCVNVTIPQGAGSPTGAPGYEPDVITVVVGVNNTVVWKNDDQAIHSVTAKDNSFNDVRMNPGDIFIYTFQKPGVYPYYCIYHSWMKGTVIVKAPS
jgi:plastocyanin